MAICPNPLCAGGLEMPRQPDWVCLRFSQSLSSQGLGASHPYELLNLGIIFHCALCVSFFHSRTFTCVASLMRVRFLGFAQEYLLIFWC